MKPLNSGLFLVLAIVLLLGGLAVLPAAGEMENEPNLKSDIPRLDTSIKEQKSPPLKGSVQHSEQLVPKTKAALKGSTSANKGNGLAGRGRFDSGGYLRGNDRTSRLDAQVESGIGIIGVKFVMMLGRPPVINRVFPGTPAAERGLRPNDIIVAVDGIPTFGLTKDEVYNMIVGTPHTPVTISVRRRSDFQVQTMLRMDFNDITDPRVRRDYQSM